MGVGIDVKTMSPLHGTQRIDTFALEKKKRTRTLCCVLRRTECAPLNLPKGTDDNPIHIDEARFAGRRKYNRSRLLEGDAPTIVEDDDADVRNMRNHGARVDDYGSLVSARAQIAAILWLNEAI